MPAYFLVLSLWFCLLVERNKRINYASSRFTFLALKSLSWAKPWLMVDVFLIGVLVSLIKIAALADVSMGLSFWAFCIYAMLVVKTISLVDFDWLWERLVPTKTPQEPMIGSIFQNKQHLACHICGQYIITATAFIIVLFATRTYIASNLLRICRSLGHCCLHP